MKSQRFLWIVRRTKCLWPTAHAAQQYTVHTVYNSHLCTQYSIMYAPSLHSWDCYPILNHWTHDHPVQVLFKSSGAYLQVLILRCLSSGAYLQVLIFRYLSSGAYPQVLIFRCLSSVAYLQVLILRCLSSGVLTGTGVSNVVEPQLIFIKFQRSLKLKWIIQ